MKHNRLITTLYAWNDLLWALLSCILVISAVLLMLEHKKAEEESKQASLGNLSIYVEWAYDYDVDIDLWFDYPGCAGCPVSYLNLQTPRGWLGRDDKGSVDSRQNNENATIYDLEPGEYIVNLHAFAYHAKSFPASAWVEIKLRDGKSVRTVFTGNAMLERVGQEITVVRFILDKDLKILGQNHIFKSLKDPQ